MTRNSCLKELRLGKNNMNTDLIASNGGHLVMVPKELQCKGAQIFTLGQNWFSY